MKAGAKAAIVVASIIALTFAAGSVIIPPYATIETEYGTIDAHGLLTNAQVADSIKRQIQYTSITVLDYDGQAFAQAEPPIQAIDTAGIASAIRVTPNLKRYFQPNQRVDVAEYVDYSASAVQDFLDASNPEPELPQDAYVDFSEEEQAMVVVPEEYGHTYVQDAAERVISAFKASPLTQVDLVAEGCYVQPEVTSEDTLLNETVQAMNEYKDIVLSYTVDKRVETIDFAKVRDNLSSNRGIGRHLDERMPLIIDEDGIRGYVKSLADTYTTLGTERVFETSTGETVTVPAGDYGWVLDEESLFEDIMTHLTSKTSTETAMPFTNEGFGFSDTDIGDTYVEVSIENQHCWFYQDGELVFDTDVVTGDLRFNRETNRGTFKIDKMERNRTLRGPGYASFVNYWMPFDRAIGLHDATWRKAFGGEIYKSDGSHGCVNMPFAMAKQLFELTSVGMPVVVW